MIGKVTTGGGSAGALDYGLGNKKEQIEKDKARDKEQQERRAKTRQERDAARFPAEPASRDSPGWEEGRRARVIGGNLPGATDAELRRGFRDFEEQRPDVKNVIHHASISFPPGVRVTTEQWRHIGETYIREMGYERSAYVFIQHRDAEKNNQVRDHMHIYATNVTIDGKVVDQFRQKRRAEQIMRGLEVELGFEPVKPSAGVGKRSPQRGEQERFERTGELSTRMSLQDSIDSTMLTARTTSKFIEQMRLRGTLVKFERHDERWGVTYERDGQVMRGGDLGDDYKFTGLQKRGMSYELERDAHAIAAARGEFLEAQLERERSKLLTLREQLPKSEAVSVEEFDAGDPRAMNDPGKFLKALKPGESLTSEDLDEAIGTFGEHLERAQIVAAAERRFDHTLADLSATTRELEMPSHTELDGRTHPFAEPDSSEFLYSAPEGTSPFDFAQPQLDVHQFGDYTTPDLTSDLLAGAVPNFIYDNDLDFVSESSLDLLQQTTRRDDQLDGMTAPPQATSIGHTEDHSAEDALNTATLPLAEIVAERQAATAALNRPVAPAAENTDEVSRYESPSVDF